MSRRWTSGKHAGRRHQSLSGRRGVFTRIIAVMVAVVIAAPPAYGAVAGQTAFPFSLGALFGLTTQADDDNARSATVDVSSRVADSSTANDYTTILGQSSDGGRYTGRVWTDKSVYTGGATLDSKTIANDSDFLTVYSALGSTRVVNGQATVPLDVVLMLDVSTSMSPRAQNAPNNDPIVELTSSANALIGDLMSMNPENRVGVVTYAGGSFVAMPLDHYTPGDQGANDYLRLQQNWGNKYYNSLYSRATGERSGRVTATQPYFYADSTYLQGAIFQGTNILANEPITTYTNNSGKEEARIPAIIVLTDGGTNIVTANGTGGSTTGGRNWWNPYGGDVTDYSIPRQGGNYWAVPNGNPLYASVSSNAHNYNEAIAPRTLAVLLGAARQKMIVEDHYKVSMQGYSIGYNINGLGRNEREQLYTTMDPAHYFSATATGPANTIDAGQAYNQARKAYETWEQYKRGQSPTLNWVLSGEWLKTKLQGSWTYNHPSSFDPATLNDLNYVNEFYVSSPGTLGNIFEDIYSQLGGIAFHPVSSGGETGSGGVLYTDPLGDYMELKDLKTLRLFGVDYPIRDNGDGTYTVTSENGQDATIRNPEYINDASFKLSDIKIHVESTPNAGTSSSSNQPGIPNVDSQVLYVILPETALPLRKETIDLNIQTDSAGHQTVRSYSSNASSVVPLRLFYTVGISDDIKDASGVVDLSKVSNSYKSDHTAINAATGNEEVGFYSNLYSATPGNSVNAGIDGTVGDAKVEFTPDISNRYYYFQKNRVIYSSGSEGVVGEGGSVANPVTTASLDPNKTYYFVIDYYAPIEGTTSDGRYMELVVARTGAELSGEINAVTFIDRPSGYYVNTPVTEYDNQPAANRVMATKRGGVRLGRLNAFARVKGSSNNTPVPGTPEGGPTGTAEYNFVPTYTTAQTSNEHFTVYQGNNGFLSVANTAVQVHKVVEKTADVDGNELSYGNEPSFNYTIAFQGLANRKVWATEEELHIADNGERTWADKVDASGNPIVRELNLDAAGKATFKLKHGEGLRFSSLPAGIDYTVTEEDAVDGVAAGMSNTLGQEDPDGFFFFKDLAGNGTVDDDTRTISSTTTSGVVQQAYYVNQFTKTTTAGRTLPVYKELEGRDFESSDEFTFIMTPGSQSEGGIPNTPMPKGRFTSADGTTYSRTIGPNIVGTELAGSNPATYRSATPLLFIGDDGSGSVDPDTVITYTQPGTYTYIFREQRPSGGSSIAGITYENTVYRLRVKVSIENNQLVATPESIERRNGDNSAYEGYWTNGNGDPSLTFHNRFSVDDVSRTFQGRKVLDGQTLQSGQFTYVLSALGSHPVVLNDTYDALKDDSLLTPEQKVQYIEDHAGVDIPGWNDRDTAQPMPGNGEAGYRFSPNAYATNGAGGLITFPETRFDSSLELTSMENTSLRGVIYKYEVREQQPTQDGSFGGAGLPGARKITVDGEERWYYQGVIYDKSIKTFYVYAHLDECQDAAGDSGTVVHAIYLGAIPFNLETGNNFSNQYRASTEMPLVGLKTMTGRPFQGADAQAGIPADSFTFHVSGSRITGTGSASSAPLPDGVDGAGNVTITPTFGNEASVDFGTITFSNEDAGNTYRYTISETGSGGNGVTNDSDPRIINVTVTDDGLGNIGYTVTDPDGTAVPTNPVSIWANRYEPQSVGVNLNGSKTFVGHPLTTGAFGFDVTQTDANGTPVEGGMSNYVTNQQGSEVEGSAGQAYKGSVAFLNASWSRFTQAGEYYFLIAENEVHHLPDGTAVDFDSSQYLVTVSVTDNHVGSLESRISKVQKRTNPASAWSELTPDSDGNYDVSFENDYAGQTMQVLSLRKQFVGAATNVMDPHTFVIEGESRDGSPVDGIRLPGMTEVQNDSDGNIQFDPVTFTKEGTYALHVREKQPTVDGTFDGQPLPGAHKVNVDGTERWYYQGVNYDNHTATSIFTVTRDPDTGGLNALRTSTTTTRVFTNYTNLSIEKQIQGTLTEEDANEEFTYTVRAWTAPELGESQNTPVTGTYTVEIYTTSNNQRVEGAQDSITLAADADGIEGSGTITIKGGQIARIIGLPTDCGYVITEDLTEEQAKGWTIVEPANGEVQGNLSLGVNSHYTFVNRKGFPETPDAIANLTATKVVTSPADVEKPFELSAGDFSFILYPDQDNPAGDPITQPRVIENDAKGNIAVLDNVLFTQPGTYVYTLVEDSASPMPNMIYDTSIYMVTVKVEKNEAGIYEANVSLTRDGEPYDGIRPLFDNHYQPGVITAGIQGKKVLNGRPLLNREFNFMLTPVSARVAELDQATEDAAALLHDSAGNIATGKSDAVMSNGQDADLADGAELPDADRKAAINDAADQTEGLAEEEPTDNAIELDAVPNNKPFDSPSANPTGDDGTFALEDPPSAKKLYKDAYIDMDMTDMPMPTNGVLVGEGPSVTTTNYLGDVFAFEGMLFDRPGVYTYQVTEVNEGKEGVTYDATKYLVEITVTQPNPDEDTLETSVRIIEPENADELVFVNEVTPEEPENPGIPNEPAGPPSDAPKPTDGLQTDTGDRTNLMGPMVLGGTAFFAACLLEFLRRKKPAPEVSRLIRRSQRK